MGSEGEGERMGEGRMGIEGNMGVGGKTEDGKTKSWEEERRLSTHTPTW